METCEICGAETEATLCSSCEAKRVVKQLHKTERWVKRGAKKATARWRRERDSVMRDHGMIKVRGALGGVYWE